MTLLEFLALGVDIVYSDLPENSAITNGIGLSFKSGDSQSLAESLKRALAGECSNEEESRKSILRMHDWDEITEKYIACYQEAVSLRNQ